MIRLGRWCLAFLSFAPTLLLAVAAEPECATISIWVGELSSDLPTLAPFGDAYFLGEGFHGNRVYRVIPYDRNQSRTFIVKIYAWPSLLENDLQGFTTLAGLRLNARDHFTVARAQRSATIPDALTLEDIQGSTVADVLRDTNRSLAERRGILALYHRRLDAVESALRRRYPEATFDPFVRPERFEGTDGEAIVGYRALVVQIRTSEGKTFKIILRADNVVISADGGSPPRMTVIDPY